MKSTDRKTRIQEMVLQIEAEKLLLKSDKEVERKNTIKVSFNMNKQLKNDFFKEVGKGNASKTLEVMIEKFLKSRAEKKSAPPKIAETLVDACNVAQ
jgi:1,2-phenylacetyl-CoA epoxidase catalytic subunit